MMHRIALAIIIIAMLSGLTFSAYSQTDNTAIDDQAIRNIEMGMDNPGTSATDLNQGDVSNLNVPAANVQMRSLTGSWEMELDNGININLNISQSENMVFGNGNVKIGRAHV